MSYVDASGAEAYRNARHGPDGAVLLDPVFTGHIQELCPSRKVADIGCGAATWAIDAVIRGGAVAVRGFDNSTQMLEQAEQALGDLEDKTVKEKIIIGYGTAKYTGTDSESFDVALSLNVGCALPSHDTSKKAEDGTLIDHMREMGRILVQGGYGIITAPVSLETVFTTDGDINAIIADFEELLSQVEDSSGAKQAVGLNTDVMRATIIEDAGGRFRIAKPRELWVGREVLRKIPGLVVPNYVHTQTEYEEAIAIAGLEIIQRDTPTLTGQQQVNDLNLGPQYIHHNPFAIYLVQKPA